MWSADIGAEVVEIGRSITGDHTRGSGLSFDDAAITGGQVLFH